MAPRPKLPPSFTQPEPILFRKIAEANQGWQQNPMQPLYVGGGSLSNVVVSQSATPSSTFRAADLLNKP